MQRGLAVIRSAIDVPSTRSSNAPTDPTPVIPREEAYRDVEVTVDHYLDNFRLLEGSERAALGFVNAPEDAYLHIGRHPTTGSPRYAHELNLPGLRSWPLTRYPQIVFYVERSDHIDVWRVLDGKRDVPQWMSEPKQV